jgi:hypothetical protein
MYNFKKRVLPFRLIDYGAYPMQPRLCSLFKGELSWKANIGILFNLTL